MSDPKFGLYYHDTGTGKTCQIINHYTKFIGKVDAILVIVPNDKIISQLQKDLIKTCRPEIPQGSIPPVMFVRTLTGAVNLVRELRTSGSVNKNNSNNTAASKDPNSTNVPVRFKFVRNSKGAVELVSESRTPGNAKSNKVPVGFGIENNAASQSLLNGSWMLLIDEVHKHSSTDMSIPLNSLTKVSKASEQLYELSSFLIIKYAFGFTATPMVDSPSEMFNVLGNMSALVNIRIPNFLKNRQDVNSEQLKNVPYIEKFGKMLTSYKRAGALLDRKRMKVTEKNKNNKFIFPELDLTQCYFDPYTGNLTYPVQCAVKSVNSHTNTTGKRSATKVEFNRTHTISWPKMGPAAKVCLNDKLEKILELCNHTDYRHTPILIYTRYVEDGVMRILDHLKYKISGNIVALTRDMGDNVRKEQYNQYNSVDNRNGGLIKVMIISQFMATGYDFRNTRLMILVEPDFNPGTLQQAIGRVVRRNIFDSDPNTSNVRVRGHVKIVGLLSKMPENKPPKQLMTYDEQVYAGLKRKFGRIQSAGKKFGEVSASNVSRMATNATNATKFKLEQINFANNLATGAISSFNSLKINKNYSTVGDIHQQATNEITKLMNRIKENNPFAILRSTLVLLSKTRQIVDRLKPKPKNAKPLQKTDSASTKNVSAKLTSAKDVRRSPRPASAAPGPVGGVKKSKRPSSARLAPGSRISALARQHRLSTAWGPNSNIRTHV